MIYGYISFIFRSINIFKNITLLVWALLIITTLLGVVHEDIKSSLMVNLSLITPLVISGLNINYTNFSKQVIIASIGNILLIYLIAENPLSWNSNTIAFLIFCGLSVGMIWFKTANRLKYKVLSSAYLFFGSSALFMTGCRNAGMVIIACYILLLIPERIYHVTIVFRGIFISVMLATIFASDFMLTILNDENIMSQITEFTSSFSDKGWGMDTHYMVLLFIKSKLAEFDIIRLLFGAGIKTYHCHNLFYQCVLFYGYIGTLLVYAIYAFIFECALKLIKKDNDKISLSCFIILIGHFMMQIGEVYMLGAETIMLMALLPAGIILQRYRNNFIG